MPATLIPILPKKFKASPEELAKAIEETIDEADKQFARTYRTFQHKPTFEKNMKVSDAEIEGSVLTSGDGSKENPYPFVAKGTRVRYARMSPGFVSKTQPGLISSRRGRGGVIRVDKSKPLSGIEARRFEENIARIQKPRLNTRLNKALGRYVKKSGHAI